MTGTITQYQFFQKLKLLPFVEAIYLFGSRARGDNDLRSDIDLAINCPKATNKDWRTIMDIIENADTLLKIDCIRLDSEKDTELSQNILKHNTILYKRMD